MAMTYKTIQLNIQAPQVEEQTINDIAAPKEPAPQTISQQAKPASIAQPAPKQTEINSPQAEIITPTAKIAEPKKDRVTISSTELIQQAKNLTDVQISDEFTARTDMKKPQETPWNTTPTSQGPYADIPYLASYDLAVDMDFYAEGYRGDIERFFDKVILKKTFTTKYGTKISCALAVVLVCSWK